MAAAVQGSIDSWAISGNRGAKKQSKARSDRKWVSSEVSGGPATGAEQAPWEGIASASGVTLEAPVMWILWQLQPKLDMNLD